MLLHEVQEEAVETGEPKTDEVMAVTTKAQTRRQREETYAGAERSNCRGSATGNPRRIGVEGGGGSRGI